MQLTKKNLLLILVFVAVCVFAFVGCDKSSEETPVPEVVTEHTITYAGVDGANNPNTIDKYNKNDEEITLKAPSKENYTFVNWTYNGEVVTKINPLWDQSITLVANWKQNNCYLKLDYDLSENYRFYFLNEPFSANFYLFGKHLRVAPEVHLIIDELDKDLVIPYSSRYVKVTGFDTKTVGTKHVNIIVEFPIGDVDYLATASYDVEVKDYDHDKYGYDVVPTDKILNWPEGYELEAKAKNESLVYAYNWFSSNEAPDHAEKCSLPNYNPYLKYTGTTAFTNKYELTAANYNPNGNTMKLCTIYQDLTRVYTDEIKITYSDLPATQDDYAVVGDYMIPKGVVDEGTTFNLADAGIGTGTIQFIYKSDGSREFIFTNVNYSGQQYKSDLSISGYGFRYYFGEDATNKEITLKFIGDNFISQPVYRDNGYPLAMNIQYWGSDPKGEEKWTINLIGGTSAGGDSLNINGGSTAFYTDCKLVIDNIDLNVTSHLDFRTNAINAYSIDVKEKAKLRLYNNGTGMLAMSGNLKVESGAVVDCKITMPHTNLELDTLCIIEAAGNITIESENVSVEVFLSDCIYGDAEGVKSCALIGSIYGDVILDGAKCSLKAYASHYGGSKPGFGTVVAIDTPESKERPENTGKVIIKNNSNIVIDLQCNAFNGAEGISSILELKITDSTVDIRLNSISEIIGLMCSKGDITLTNSVATIVSIRANTVASAYGVNATGVTVEDSKLSVDMNTGVALYAFVGIEDHPSTYTPGYEPTKLTGFDSIPNIAKASIMNPDTKAPGTYIAYETIYEQKGTTWAQVSQFEVDNRP